MFTEVYIYELTEVNGDHVIRLQLRDVPGPSNDWRELSESGVLLLGGGAVRTDDAGQHCMADGEELLVLEGASWSTTVGDTGTATLAAPNGSGDEYRWTLVERFSD